MFDGLRKKFQNAVKLFSDKEEKKIEENLSDSDNTPQIDSSSNTTSQNPFFDNSKDTVFDNHEDNI